MNTTTDNTDEVNEILAELIGLPLKKDTSYIPMSNDPFGRIQLTNTNNRSVNIQETSMESQETISRQYKRLTKTKADLDRYYASKYGKKLLYARIDEAEHKIVDGGIWHEDYRRDFPQKITLGERIVELKTELAQLSKLSTETGEGEK